MQSLNNSAPFIESCLHYNSYAKITKLHLSFLRNRNIGVFYIPLDDTVEINLADGLGDLPKDWDNPFLKQPSRRLHQGRYASAGAVIRL